MPKPATDATGRTIFTPGRSANPLSFFAYFVADRPGAYATTTRKATVEGGPVALDRPVLARRHGLGQARRRPHGQGAAGARARRSACRGRRPGTADGPGGGQPLDRRLCRPVRPGQGRRRDRLLRRPLRGPPRGRPRLVQRLAPRRPLGQRGVRLVLRAPGGRGPEGQGDRRRADPEAQGRADPAQRVGPGRARTGATEDYAYAASLALATAIAERADARRAAGRLGGRGRPCRRLPAAVGRHARDGRRRPGLARPPRPARGRDRQPLRRPVADVGRPRRGPAAARCAGRRPRRATTRSSARPATGRCRSPSATRCGPGGSTTRPGCSTRRAPSSPGAPRSRRTPRRSA